MLTCSGVPLLAWKIRFHWVESSARRGSAATFSTAMTSRMTRQDIALRPAAPGPPLPSILPDPRPRWKNAR